ncbi:MAG: ABC transporter ATP-binding protein [Deltaproteobacteria bacterium]|nr:ABC transporter ATP-binding protein [Deltaproteobacteria bacterium]MCB9786437.1 ABC transporter ATP-binding protein [Deltaproteobacteria bacterium]
MSAELAIACRGLRRRFGALVAVDGLELEVVRGECFALLGPNGAGKTTTVEMIEGLSAPDEGAIEVLGQRWGEGAASDRRLRARIGAQLQETQLDERLTVAETLRLFASFFPSGRSVDGLIALVELESKRAARVGHLSGGQRQRLALACALAGDPSVLCLDEPTTGLDPQARRRVWDVIQGFRAEGGTVLLTTHYMGEAEVLADRVGIMDRGRIIALGTPAELIERVGAEQLVVFSVDGPLDGERVAALPGILRYREGAGGSHHVALGRDPEALAVLMKELARQDRSLRQLTTHEPTLEDVFVELTGRALRED